VHAAHSLGSGKEKAFPRNNLAKHHLSTPPFFSLIAAYYATALLKTTSLVCLHVHQKTSMIAFYNPRVGAARSLAPDRRAGRPPDM
jgi:hypothetical protein